MSTLDWDGMVESLVEVLPHSSSFSPYPSIPCIFMLLNHICFHHLPWQHVPGTQHTVFKKNHISIKLSPSELIAMSSSI